MKTPNGIVSYIALKAQRRRLILTFCILLCSVIGARAQGRLVLDGGIINLNAGAYLVIENSSPNAITRNSGHILSEGENNIIKWNIGTTTGTYTVPWGYGSCDCIALTFTKTAGTGSGYFLFSTYPTAWNNSTQLPTGVTNINGATGLDNSSFVTDRFWQINAQGYSVKPTLSNLEFTYRDAENSAPNTITENLLRGKRYNSGSNSWVDDILSSSINTTTNKLTIASVDANNLYPWWTLGTLNANRYWVAPSSSNSGLAANWSETAGGPGNAGVPIPGDAVFFDASSSYNCVLDSDLSASSLIVTSDFGGIITQGSNAISVDGNAVFSGGAFNGGTANLSVGGDFTVAGTTFTAPSATLDVKGDFSVTSGTFLHNNGTVALSGSSGAQTINSSSILTINNINASNTSASPGVIVESSQNLKGVLTLASNVNVDTDGSSNAVVFKLLSTADSPTQDASIATLPSGAQISGKVTVQRFMSKEGFNSNRVYRYISSPLSNGTVADLQQEIPVTGTFTGRSSCSGCTSSSPSLYYYHEPVVTDTDYNGIANLHDGYIDFPNIANSETFQTGKGYALYVRGNILSSTLWDLRGNINTGNVTPVSLPVTYTSSGTLENDGWNLVGNPFPSTIDWSSLSGWTKTNLESSIYVTDNASATGVRFATWNGVVGTNGGSRYIATGQGFWVKANGGGAPGLQADENVKVAGTQTNFFREIQSSNLLRVTLSQGTVRDETVIHFRDDANAGFDSHADARKLPNDFVNISSVLEDGRKVAINSLSAANCTELIALSVDNVKPGNYTLQFGDVGTFDEAIAITLVDNFLNRTHNIRNGSYNFSVTTASATFGTSRFALSFSGPTLDSTVVANVDDVCEGTDAIVSIKHAQSGVTYTALLGNESLSLKDENGIQTLRIPHGKLKAGRNTFTIRSTTPWCSNAVETEITFSVHSFDAIIASDAVRCEPGSLTLQVNGAVTGLYNWYEDETSVHAIASHHNGVFETSVLKKSKTYYVAAVNSLGCEGKRVPIRAVVVNPEPLVINADATTLTSNYASGNQWLFNGQKIEGATGQTIQPKRSGVYKAEATIEGCMVWAEVQFTIPPVLPGTVSKQLNSNAPGDTTTTGELLPPPSEPHVSNTAVLQVSPNPVHETAVLEISDTFKNVTKVRLMNGLGKLMADIDVQSLADKKVAILTMTDYPAGIYIVQIFSASGIHECKIIKR
jgi:hypothetical protein